MSEATPDSPIKGSPLTKAEHERILDLHREGLSRVQIRKATGRSNGAVDKVIQEAAAAGDPTVRLGQSTTSRTHEALRARHAYAIEARAELADKLAHRAVEMADQFGASKTTVFSFGGRDNTFASEDVTGVPIDMKAKLAKATSDLVGALLKLQAADAKGDEGGSAVDAWLDWVTGEGVDDGATLCPHCQGTGVTVEGPSIEEGTAT